MFIVNVSIKVNEISKERLAELLENHRAWFTRHFEQGNFLLLGPYLDWEGSGIVLAQAQSRDALEKMLAEDVFYANGLADYMVHEFKAAMIAENLRDFRES